MTAPFGPDPEPTEWRDYGDAYEISKEGYARDKKRKKYLTLVTEGEGAPYYYFRLPRKGGMRQTTRTLPIVVKSAWNAYITVTKETAETMKHNILEWNLANFKFNTSSGAPCNLDITAPDYGDGCTVNSSQYCPVPGVKEW